MSSRGLLLLLGIGGVLVLVIALDRLALWLEARGLLYWRRTKHRTGGSLGHALLEIHSMLEPGRRYEIEELQREAEQDEVAEKKGGEEPPRDA